MVGPYGQEQTDDDQIVPPPEADSSDETAPVHESVVPLECEVCGGDIPPGTKYMQAAYGPVHIEPCSHEGKVGPGIPQLGV